MSIIKILRTMKPSDFDRYRDIVRLINEVSTASGCSYEEAKNLLSNKDDHIEESKESSFVSGSTETSRNPLDAEDTSNRVLSTGHTLYHRADGSWACKGGSIDGSLEEWGLSTFGPVKFK